MSPCLKRQLYKLLKLFRARSLGVGNTSLQLMCSLLRSKETGLNETIINLRARLQQQNPKLFIHYMAANP